MPDKIIGTAVLDRRESPEFLYVCCQCSDGIVRTCSIPVRPKGAPRAMTPQWEYEEHGDVLHVTPSVNWVGVFHNEGSWQVKFVEFLWCEGTPNYRLKELNPGV